MERKAWFAAGLPLFPPLIATASRNGEKLRFERVSGPERMESTVEELIRTIHPHPTMSEGVGEAAHATHGAAINI